MNGEITHDVLVVPGYLVLSAVVMNIHCYCVLINCIALNWEKRSEKLKA